MHMMPPAAGKSAIVIGATGLVGRECVRQLAAHSAFERVTALARRALPSDLVAAKVKTELVDFDRLAARPEIFQATHLFCALGTTIKQAGSQDRFRQVDFGYPLRAAELALAAGVRHFLLVSSVDANPVSRSFYLRVKGELEAAIEGLGFRALTIVRPSLLLGDRNEFRLTEEIAKRLSWAFPRKYRPVHARDVTAALVAAAAVARPGVNRIENPAIAR